MSTKEQFVATEHQHQRYNPLTGEWVLVCPHRMLRPWLGQKEDPLLDDLPEFDPTNPLCPGVVRANGEKTLEYTSTYVFTNDFPALLENVPDPIPDSDPLFQMRPAKGNCRVMCFHPKSNKTLPVMTITEIEAVIVAWKTQFEELSRKYHWVQIFENKGAAMGCSNPHPHCQIWSCSFLPSVPALKDQHLKAYFRKHGTTLLSDYVTREIERKDRIVCLNEDWVALVPFWASWPFETMLITRDSHLKRFDQLSERQIQSLAIIIKKLTTKYENLFQCSFPYSMGWHGAPTPLNESWGNYEHWNLHATYYPPLLRSSSVRKFMVGFELLCQSQRDLTPEQAAQRLRDLDGSQHYSGLVQK